MLKNIVLRGYKVLVFNDSIGHEPITGRGKAGCIPPCSLAVQRKWLRSLSIP